MRYAVRIADAQLPLDPRCKRRDNIRQGAAFACDISEIMCYYYLIDRFGINAAVRNGEGRGFCGHVGRKDILLCIPAFQDPGDLAELLDNIQYRSVEQRSLF